ncbi:glycosyltransferase family 9 protein [Desulfovibrio cuneatus]|uniref:glycosyltransferase family 9 protein n=1 Tax=Desulfovibrio cuneatus TaxID=159728 RepID=UPI000402C839|nr:glycosyltransferase family 9 protein [Desulfovibrio cuneatus]
MNTLLISLTRFGDLLQSQAAVRELAANGGRVGVVCLENFAPAVQLLEGVDVVFPLPSSGLLAALHAPASSSPATGALCPGWMHALGGLAQWRNAVLQDFPPDYVCNLTPTLSARILSLFLAGDAPITGFGLDAQGFSVNSSLWVSFLQGASQVRGVSPFNVVDVFRRVAAPACTAQVPISFPLPEGTTGLCGNARLRAPQGAMHAAALDGMRQEAPQEAKGFVGMQLGASDNKRRWPVAYFVEAGQALWDTHKLCPVLLGSASELELAERYIAQATHPVVSRCGKTSLLELASLVQGLNVLITNDTGTMHLAAGLGVPLVSIFLATAQPFDTGPYSVGSVCLEPGLPCHPCAFGSACPRNNECRYSISPALVARYAHALFKEQPLAPGACPEAVLAGTRVWLSEFDTTGEISLASLSGHQQEDRSVWLFLLRELLRQFLDRQRTVPFVLQTSHLRFCCSPDMRQKLQGELARLCGTLELMQQQGRLLLVRRLEHVQKKFLAGWESVFSLLRASPYFAALAFVWQEETQAEGQSMPDVLEVMGQFQSLFVNLAAFIAV